MPLDYFQLSRIGDRETNQDYMMNKVCPSYALFMVADGLGGHLAGEKASRYFCQGVFSLVDKFLPALQEDPKAVFQQWLNEAVDEMSRQFGDDADVKYAHTTCAILYLDQSRVVTAHCGDSRIYRIKPDKILWRTRDHSATQQMLDEGLLSESEMGSHPVQNQLIRSINVQNLHQSDVSVFPPMERDETFILCSDGFWEYIKETELLQLAQSSSDEQTLEKYAKLMQLRASGKSDNITVQLLRWV